jgi:hypothetical protein
MTTMTISIRTPRELVLLLAIILLIGGNFVQYLSVTDETTFWSNKEKSRSSTKNVAQTWKNEVKASPFGIMHFHDICRSDEAAKSRKAMIGHGYINESDTPEMVIAKYKREVPALAYDICNVKDDTFTVASSHKITNYLRYIGGCHESNVNDGLVSAFGAAFKNPEFGQFFDETLAKYAPLSIF